MGGHNPPILRAKENKEIEVKKQLSSAEQHLLMVTHHLVFHWQGESHVWVWIHS